MASIRHNLPWNGPARGSFRVMACVFAVLMLLAAGLFAMRFTDTQSWTDLLWGPVFLLNAGGFFGVARTGYLWRFRRPTGT